MEQAIQKFLQKGELKKALDVLENLNKKNDSENISVLFYLGKIYFELNDHKKSIFYFRKCNQNSDNSKSN